MYKYCLILIILLTCLGASYKNEAHLQVRNDYSFTLKLYVKCGKWLGNKFEYERLFVFPTGKTTNLTVPKQYDRCQVWPSHKW